MRIDVDVDVDTMCNDIALVDKKYKIQIKMKHIVRLNKWS